MSMIPFPLGLAPSIQVPLVTTVAWAERTAESTRSDNPSRGFLRLTVDMEYQGVRPRWPLYWTDVVRQLAVGYGIAYPDQVDREGLERGLEALLPTSLAAPGNRDESRTNVLEYPKSFRGRQDWGFALQILSQYLPLFDLIKNKESLMQILDDEVVPIIERAGIKGLSSIESELDDRFPVFLDPSYSLMRKNAAMLILMAWYRDDPPMESEATESSHVSELILEREMIFFLDDLKDRKCDHLAQRITLSDRGRQKTRR